MKIHPFCDTITTFMKVSNKAAQFSLKIPLQLHNQLSRASAGAPARRRDGEEAARPQLLLSTPFCVPTQNRELTVVTGEFLTDPSPFRPCTPIPLPTAQVMPGYTNTGSTI